MESWTICAYFLSRVSNGVTQQPTLLIGALPPNTAVPHVSVWAIKGLNEFQASAIFDFNEHEEPKLLRSLGIENCKKWVRCWEVTPKNFGYGTKWIRWEFALEWKSESKTPLTTLEAEIPIKALKKACVDVTKKSYSPQALQTTLKKLKFAPEIIPIIISFFPSHPVWRDRPERGRFQRPESKKSKCVVM